MGAKMKLLKDDSEHYETLQDDPKASAIVNCHEEAKVVRLTRAEDNLDTSLTHEASMC